MPHKLKYDWDEIQKFYDKGHSIRECAAKFGFSPTARAKAIKAGRLVTRKPQKADSTIQTEGATPSRTTIKGEIGCLKVEQRALEIGAIVSRPTIECGYDRIIDWNGKISRVQIKYANSSNSKGSVKCRLERTSNQSNDKYYADEVDVVIAYIPALDKLCWFEPEMFNGRHSITIRYQPAKSGRKKDVVNIDEFIW